MMNRATFFDKIRHTVFDGALSASTVRGCNAILDEWERRNLKDLRHLAYMLATVRGECGANMLPVREGFKKTDAEARAYVSSKHYKYAKVVNGQVYYGRGLVQLTHDYNYASMGDLLKIDLKGNPDFALDPKIAAQIMFEGMARGIFTGKKLSDFFTNQKADYYNARTIINGHDRAAEFEKWGVQFAAALAAAEDGKAVIPPPPDVPPVVVKPKVAPTPKKGNLAGAGAVIVATGAGAVIANQSSKNGASTSQIAIVVGLSLVIAVAAFFIVRQFFKKD